MGTILAILCRQLIHKSYLSETGVHQADAWHIFGIILYIGITISCSGSLWCRCCSWRNQKVSPNLATCRPNFHSNQFKPTSRPRPANHGRMRCACAAVSLDVQAKLEECRAICSKNAAVLTKSAERAWGTFEFASFFTLPHLSHDGMDHRGCWIFERKKVSLTSVQIPLFIPLTKIL